MNFIRYRPETGKVIYDKPEDNNVREYLGELEKLEDLDVFLKKLQKIFSEIKNKEEFYFNIYPGCTGGPNIRFLIKEKTKDGEEKTHLYYIGLYFYDFKDIDNFSINNPEINKKLKIIFNKIKKELNIPYKNFMGEAVKKDLVDSRKIRRMTYPLEENINYFKNKLPEILYFVPKISKDDKGDYKILNLQEKLFLLKINIFQKKLQTYGIKKYGEKGFLKELKQEINGEKGDVQTYKLLLGEEIILYCDFGIEDNKLEVYYIETCNGSSQFCSKINLKYAGYFLINKIFKISENYHINNIYFKHIINELFFEKVINIFNFNYKIYVEGDNNITLHIIK